MTQITLEAALPPLRWSRVWNPNRPIQDLAAAWQELKLPNDYAEWQTDFRRAFGADFSLDVPRSLGLDENRFEADIDKACATLTLSWDGVGLPRRHVAAVTEILAYAVERSEPELADSLARQYLLPWCEWAERIILTEDPALSFLLEDFAQDLVAVKLSGVP